jgi:hypothetical protein
MTALWNTVPCSLVETDEVSDVLTASAMSSMSLNGILPVSVSVHSNCVNKYY